VILDVAAKRVMKLDQIGKVPELIEIMGDNFQTDMQPKFIIDLAKQMLTGGKVDMTSYTIMGEGMKIGGVYYNEPDMEDVQEARDLIDSWMNPETPVTRMMS
jgi:anionic cell wall polymer biosynthesis LytR-Cps2A-Psr (LCP) family protein